MKTTCLIIPTFNEKNNIKLLYKNISLLLNKFDWLYFLIVDNGSVDGTSESLKFEFSNSELTEMSDRVQIVSVQVNNGYGAGIKHGLRHVNHPLVGWMHADGQVSIKSVENYLEQLQENWRADVISKGSRVKLPIVDRFFTKSLSLLSSALFGLKITDANGQPTVLSSCYSTELFKAPDDYKFDLYVFVLAKKFNIPVVQYAVDYQPRFAGTSSWNTGMLARLRISINYIQHLLHLLALRAIGKL